MADNLISKKYNILYNSISNQQLTYPNQLTIKSWNDIVNILRVQSNVNAEQLKVLYTWLIGPGEEPVENPGGDIGYVEYVSNSIDDLYAKLNKLGIKFDTAVNTLNNTIDNAVNKINTNITTINSNISTIHHIITFLATKDEVPKNLDDLNVKTKDVVEVETQQVGINGVTVIETEHVGTQKVETLSLGTSATYNKDDDTQVPTSKAISKYIDSLISMFPKLSFEVVTELPTENISDTTLYLVQGTGGTEDDFAEYIYINGEWELLGHARLDLKNYYSKTESEENFVSKKSTAENLISSKNTYYVAPKSVMDPTEKEHLVNKKYVDNKLLSKEATIYYQAQVDGGTYPRLMKYDDDTLYLFTDNAYSISKDGGKTWSNRVVVCDIESENESLGRNDIDDVANAFPALLDDSGRIVVFYRCHSRANNYYSIVARVSNTSGVNFETRQELFHSTSGYWEPFYIDGALYYSAEHGGSGSGCAQSLFRRIVNLNENGNLAVGGSKSFIDGRKEINIDGNPNTLARIGMVSVAPLKNGYYIYVMENSVNNNASSSRPMVVQYIYGQKPASIGNVDTIGRKTLFMGGNGITMGAPYVTTLDDGRVVISFQTDQFYEGVTPENKLRKKQVVVYVSKRIVNYGDDLTADDFVRLNNYFYGENDYSVWGSVQNIDGQLYSLFTLGKNKNETERLFVTNIVKRLDVNNTSTNSGGVSEEQVLDIIEENGEEVDALNIGTSTAYNVNSDREVPTTKAVANMIGALGGSNGGADLYEHYIVIQKISTDGEITYFDEENCIGEFILIVTNTNPNPITSLSELIPNGVYSKPYIAFWHYEYDISYLPNFDISDEGSWGTVHLSITGDGCYWYIENITYGNYFDTQEEYMEDDMYATISDKKIVKL